MWRKVTGKNIHDIHTAFLVCGLLLGLDMMVRGVRYISSVPSQKWWGLAIVLSVLIVAAGQIWIDRSDNPRRWLPSFAGHVLLCALYLGLAAEAFVSVEPTPNGQLAFAILYGGFGVVHRGFVHWKSDVPISE